MATEVHKQIDITFQEWKEKYKPTTDFYYEGLKGLFPKKFTVWTEYSTDEDFNIIVNDFGYVNRMGYWITQIPYKEGELIIVTCEYDENDWSQPYNN